MVLEEADRVCLTNLLCFLDKVTSCLDDKDCMDIVFLDLAKAFDKVPHRRLMEKIAKRDRQTDGRTPHDGMDRAYAWHRAVKNDAVKNFNAEETIRKSGADSEHKH